MAATISQHTLAEIKQRIRIEEVVGEFVTLKKRGGTQNLWACCPFPTHQEQTPSFTVRPAVGLFKCFGCGEGGDAITFLQKMRGINYLETMHYLAHKYQVAWVVEGRNKEEEQAHKKKEGLHLLLDLARNYYQQRVETASVQDYLKQRGIPKEITDRFMLGYSLDAWRSFYDFASQKGYDNATLIDAGLVIQKEHKIYDRFRGRLMIPILDSVGRTIGFGARILGEEQGGAKYLNSPDTIVYKKSEVLYGLYQAKEEIRKKDCCYLVEGYTDLFMMHQMGIRAVVASAGTALTNAQIRLLKRFTNQAILLFDGDEAGMKAVFRGVDLMLAAGMEVKIVSLPAGEDPASFAQKVGQRAFLDYLSSKTRDFITFKLTYFLGQQPDDPQQKTAAIHAIMQSIALIPDMIKREVYTDLCSTYTKIPKDLLQDRLKGSIKPSHAGIKRNPVPQKQRTKSKHIQEEGAILSLLLRHGNEEVSEDGTRLATFLFQALDERFFSSPTHRDIYQAWQHQWETEGQVAGTFWMQSQSEEVQKKINNIMSYPYGLSDQWAAMCPISEQRILKKRLDVLTKSILRLKLKEARKLLMHEYQGIKKVKELTEERLGMFNAAKLMEMNLAKELGIVTLPPFLLA